MHFDGTDESLMCGQACNFGFDDAFSVSFWYQVTAQLAYDTFVSKTMWQGNYPLGGGVGWSVYYNNYFNFTMEGSNWAREATISNGFWAAVWTANGVAVPGDWHHMVISYNGDGLSKNNMKMYIDSYDVSTPYSDRVDGPGVLTNDAEFVIGDMDWQAGPDPPTSRSRNGNIDEVAIFDYELSQSDINLIYNGTPPSGGGAPSPAIWNDGTGVPGNLNTLSTPPVNWWRMGDDWTSGTTITDQIGDKDGTMTNMDGEDSGVKAEVPS